MDRDLIITIGVALVSGLLAPVLALPGNGLLNRRRSSKRGDDRSHSAGTTIGNTAVHHGRGDVVQTTQVDMSRHSMTHTQNIHVTSASNSSTGLSDEEVVQALLVVAAAILITATFLLHAPLISVALAAVLAGSTAMSFVLTLVERRRRDRLDRAAIITLVNHAIAVTATSVLLIATWSTERDGISLRRLRNRLPEHLGLRDAPRWTIDHLTREEWTLVVTLALGAIVCAGLLLISIGNHRNWCAALGEHQSSPERPKNCDERRSRRVDGFMSVSWRSTALALLLAAFSVALAVGWIYDLMDVVVQDDPLPTG